MLERLLKGTLAFIVKNFAVNVLQLATAIVTFRLLDVASYGQLALALSVYSFGTIFLDIGLGAVAISEIAKRRGQGQPEYVKLFLTRYLQFAALVGGILGAGFALVGQNGLVFHRTLWLLMGLYLLTTGLNSVLGAFFYSHTYFGRYILHLIIRSSLRFLLVLGLLTWPEDRLLAVAATYPLAEALALVVIWPFWVRATAPLRSVPLPQDGWRVLWTTFKEQGIFSSMTAPIKRFRDLAPVWILNITLGPLAVGLYSAAQRAFSILLSVFQSIESSSFPLFSEYMERDWASARRMIAQSVKYTFWAALVVVGLGWLLAPWFFEFVAGNEYIEALPLFRLMLLYLLIYAFAQVQAPVFYALGIQRNLLLTYAANVLSLVLFLAIGIFGFGLIGAVAAWLTSEALAVYLRYVVASRKDPGLKISLSGLLTLNEFDRKLWAQTRRRIAFPGEAEGNLPFSE